MITRLSGNDKYYNLSVDFAENVWQTNFEEYRRRNKSAGADKIIKDICIGKYCELMISDYFGDECSDADMSVYSTKDKSFDADLVMLEGDHLHVKSCVSGGLPDSWVFQKNDPLITNPKPYDIIVCCIFEQPDKSVRFFTINAVDAITLLREPIKKSLAKTKTVLYLKDILNLWSKEATNGITHV